MTPTSRKAMRAVSLRAESFMRRIENALLKDAFIVSKADLSSNDGNSTALFNSKVCFSGAADTEY